MSTEPQHILFVINSLGSGGAERVVSVLANEFSRRGLRVTIVLRANTGREVKQILLPEVAVVDLADDASDLYREVPRLARRPRFLEALLTLLPGKFRSFLLTWFVQRRLGGVVRHLQPDIAVAFMVSSNVHTTNALAASPIPVVISERTDPGRYAHRPLLRWRRNRAYAKADGLVFQTREALEYFTASIQARSAVISNPLELPPSLKRNHRRGTELRVVSVGRLVASKRFDLLIHAVASLRAKGMPVVLEIYGEGPDGDTLGSLCRKLGLEAHVRFMGFRKDVLADIVDADLFVLCSEYEGMPNALIEALGLGIPSISTDCPIGGPRALIQDGVNGLLIPVGDLGALESAMEHVLLDADLATRLGHTSVSLRDTLGARQIADRWMLELKAAMQRKTSRTAS